MRQDIIAACQMFMVPLTILFAALGVSTTHGLKAGISLVGFATSVVWGLAVWYWPQATDFEKYISTGLAAIFAAVMFSSMLYHAARYREGEDEPVGMGRH